MCTYIETYEKFKAANIRLAIEYFDKNWHSIRNEWAWYAKGDAFCLGETTNNRRLIVFIQNMLHSHSSLMIFLQF